MTKRTAADFAMFKSPEFISGYKSMATLQPLNQTDTHGLFLQNKDIDVCKWTAKQSDFEKGSVLIDYEHTFGNNKTPDQGILLIKPKIQVLWRSPLMVQERFGKGSGLNQIIGSFNDPSTKELWNTDKTKAEADPKYERMYQSRTLYLVMVLKKNRTRAHKLPIVLTTKGLAAVQISQNLKHFEEMMGYTMDKFTGAAVPQVWNEQFFSTTVWQPTFVRKRAGERKNEICGIECCEAPDFSDEDSAFASIDAMTIPTEDRESTWKMMTDYEGFIAMHSAQNVNQLGGAYGLKQGVEILPASRGTDKSDEAVDLTATSGRDSLGADSSL
tara:strand:+ start:9383 stop:10366 length:984 start_codon:yes stop_codon:yes gene_type:complete